MASRRASRGVTPAAISLLLVHLKKGGFKGLRPAAANDAGQGGALTVTPAPLERPADRVAELGLTG